MDRWANIYEHVDRPFGLAHLEAELAPSGLALERSGYEAAVAIVAPEYYTEAPRETLCVAGDLATDISLSLWWPDDVDTYCRVHLVGQVRHISLDVGPSRWDPKHQKALAKMAAAGTRDGTLVGHVFDPEAMAEDADWDELFLEGRLPQR